jgi:tetratricopeptide (TPR) repeat protein
MAEVDEEIREIKKEIIESRGLVIKTNNLTNALAADIKSIAKRQAGYERAFSFNSAAAYVLFAVLAFVGLYMAYDVRVRAVQAAKAQVERREKRLKAEVAQFRAQIDERLAAEARAEALYGQIRGGRRAEAIAAWPEVEELDLSRAEAAFLRDSVDRFRGELAMLSYREGLGHAHGGRWAEAARCFEESLHTHERAANAPEVQLALAGAYAALGRAREALAILDGIQGNADARAILDQIYMARGRSQIALGEFSQARETLRNLLRRFPTSPLVKEARNVYQSTLGHH